MNKVLEFINNHLPEDLKVKLKAVVAEVKAEETPAPSAKSYKEAPLQDGTVIKYTGDSLAVGSEIIIVTPEGEVPAPEGEHVLADGSVIVVKKEGELSIVAEIKPAEEMKKEGEPAPAAFSKEDIEKIIDSKMEAIMNENKALKDELEKLKLKAAKQSAQLKDTVLIVEAIANIPSGEPAKKPDPMNTGRMKAYGMLEYLANKNKK